jgi:tRNA pseudouridine38-40 synthase
MNIYYNLRIQFKGTRYQGWQIQPNVPTVQGAINIALETIFKTKNVHSIGSGRTDAGVHALDYLVKIEVPFSIEKNALIKAMNANLPLDIRVLSVEDSNVDFLPTNHAISKEYVYRFSNLDYPNAFQEDLIPNVSYHLDFNLMKEACLCFKGEHDFKDFQCTGSDVKTSIRTIYECDLTFVEGAQLGGFYPAHYVFRVVGSGFLKQMVRLMVGTIWNVGKQKITIEQLNAALSNPIGKKLGIVAPPNGLTKIKVTY